MAEQQSVPTVGVGPPQQKKHKGPIGKVISAIDAFYCRVKWLKNLAERLPHFPMLLILVAIWACLRLLNFGFMHTYVAAIVIAFAGMGALAVEGGQALYASFSMRRFVGDLFFAGVAANLITGVLVLIVRNGHGLSLGDGLIFVLAWIDYFGGPMIYLKARAFVGTGFAGHGDEQTVSVDVDHGAVDHM